MMPPTDDGERSVGEAHFGLCHSQATGVARCQQERLAEFYNLSFGQTIEQHEEHCQNNVFFLEESDKRAGKFVDDVADRFLLGITDSAVGSRFGEYEQVPNRHDAEENSTANHGKHPSFSLVAAKAALQSAGNHHQTALTEHVGAAVEGRADADEHTLLVCVEGNHIETVGSDVVSCRAECGDEIEEQAHHKCTYR